MGRYAFHLHPWFLATGAAGFYVYTAARAYADDLGLSAIPVKAMTVLVPHVPRDTFNETVKALIAAGAFVRLDTAIEIVVPDLGDLVPEPVPSMPDESLDDRRRRLARTRKERFLERKRNASGTLRERSGNALGVPGSGTGSGTGSGSHSSTQDPDSKGVRKGVRGKPLADGNAQGTLPGTLMERSGNADGNADGNAEERGNGTVDALVQTWNANCGKLPRVQKVTSNRRAAYRKALADHPDLADWARAAAHLTTEAWAMGGSPGHVNWFATLDYLAKPGKLAAILEKVDALNAGLKPAVTGTKAGRTDVTPGKYAHLSD